MPLPSFVHQPPGIPAARPTYALCGVTCPPVQIGLEGYPLPWYSRCQTYVRIVRGDLPPSIEPVLMRELDSC